MVVERAGGNPLFAEELSRMLGEQQSLGPDLTRGTELPHARGSLRDHRCRLDTLSAAERSLIQDASVVGEVFWAGALASMGGLDRASIDCGPPPPGTKGVVRPRRSPRSRPTWSSRSGTGLSVTLRTDRSRAAAAPRSTSRRLRGRGDRRRARLGPGRAPRLPLRRSPRAVPIRRRDGRGGSLEDTTRRYWVLAGERAMKLDVARAAECFDRALSLAPPDPSRSGGHPRVDGRRRSTPAGIGRPSGCTNKRLICSARLAIGCRWGPAWIGWPPCCGRKETLPAAEPA